MTDDSFRRIDALIGVAMRLARSAPTGRIALARIALSLDPVWIPSPWGDTIVAEIEAARQAACEPVAAAKVERALRDAWGARVAEVLDELDPEPVAVTPTAQVNKGVLDGAPVAVKVLRPGVAASVRQDLALLEGLAAPLAAAFPALDPGALLSEVRERVLDELDLEHEAMIQRRFHRALRDHPRFAVPAPVTTLSHEGVLVGEWIEGTPLASAVDRDQAAARLLVFVLGSARWGMVHADPDPDDVVVLEDGRLAILDFGATRSTDPDRLASARAAVEAFVDEDAEALGRALEQLGTLPREHAATALELGLHALGELAGGEPSRLDSEAVVAARDRLLSKPDALGRLIRAGALAPEDLWPVRGVALAFSTIARVGATGTWRELVRQGLREGWDVSGV